MASLDDLSLALRQGAQSEAGLAGLNEQYAAANKLANTQTAQPDKFSRTSGLAVLNDVFGRAQGANQLRELEPQRAAARQSMADAKHALPLYQAGVAAAKVKQDQQNYTDTASALVQSAALSNKNRQAAAEQGNTWGVENATTLNTRGVENTATATDAAKEAAKLKASASLAASVATAKAKAAQDQLKRDREDAKVPLVTKVDTKGDEHTVRYNAQTGKAYLDDGTEITDFSKWTDPATKTMDVERGSYGGKTFDKKSVEKLDAINAVDDIYGLMANVKPEQTDKMNSLGQRVKMASIASLVPKEFTALAESAFAGYDEATQEMLISLNAASGEERHRLFGSALTDTEYKSTQSFLAATVGRGIPWMRNALEKTKRSNINALLSVDGSYNGNKYRNMLTSSGLIPEGYTAKTFELGNAPEMGSNLEAEALPAPEGVNAAEWGNFSVDAQKAYLESKGDAPK